MKTTLRTIMIACTVITITSNGHCDIYRNDDGEDTISFTDSPMRGNYKLVLKEKTSFTKTNRNSSRSPYPKNAIAAINIDNSKAPLSRQLPLHGAITSTTGLRSDPFNGELKHHNGVDIAAASGTPVKPVAPGTVIFSGWRGGYGNSVIIEHLDGMMSIYAHHSSNQISEGALVDCSTVIALSGSTGRSTGPHLHFEAWKNGENITPSFIPAGTSVPQRQPLANVQVKRVLQPDGTILFTNMR